MMWVLKRAFPVVVIGALVGVTALSLAARFDLRLPFQTSTVDRSRPALLKSIEGLSEYHAAVGNFEVVLDVERDVDWVPDFVAGERSLFVAAGTVDAYVDFSGFGEGDLAMSDDGKTITIRLPEAALDKPNLDQKRTYLFSQERGVINRLNDALSTQDQRELYAKAEGKLAAAAVESELKGQADKNTRTMLVGMFQALGIKATFTDDSAE
jgi:hypothetical protein